MTGSRGSVLVSTRRYGEDCVPGDGTGVLHPFPSPWHVHLFLCSRAAAVLTTTNRKQSASLSTVGHPSKLLQLQKELLEAPIRSSDVQVTTCDLQLERKAGVVCGTEPLPVCLR